MNDDAPVELTDRDILDITALQAEPDGVKNTQSETETFRPILLIWHEVLKPAKAEQVKKVTPQWAARICAEHQQVRFQQMDDFRDRYYGKLATLNEILETEIATDDECTGYSEASDDAKHNSHHYKNLLLQWQLMFLQWELDWNCTDEASAVELAAISEAHKTFFGQVGITAFLDNINFEFTEDDQATLGAALEEFRGGRA